PPPKSTLFPYTTLFRSKNDPALRKTPVVIFSTSQAARDILGSYELGANSYVSKPGDLQQFALAVKSIQDFWFRCARLPKEEKQLDRKSTRLNSSHVSIS